MILRINRCSLIILIIFLFHNFVKTTEHSNLRIDQKYEADTKILDSSIKNYGKSKVRVTRETGFWTNLFTLFNDYAETKKLGYECFTTINERRNEPILLNGSNNLVLNEGRSRLIRFKKGESFKVSCQNPYILKKITCKENNIYVDEASKTFSLSDLNCTEKRGGNRYLGNTSIIKTTNNATNVLGNIFVPLVKAFKQAIENSPFIKRLNRTSDCFLIVKYISKKPLLLNSSDNYLLEADEYGFIDFKIGQSYRISCENPYMLKTITCKGNKTFVDEFSKPFRLYQIKCKTNYKPIERLGRKYLEIPTTQTTQIIANFNSSAIKLNHTAGKPINVALENITTTVRSINSENSIIKLNQTTDCATKVKYMRYRPTLLRFTDNYLLEQNRSGFIQLKRGESYRIACQNPYILETITCRENNTFYDESSNPFILSQIICRENYKTRTRGGKKYVDITVEKQPMKTALENVITNSTTELKQNTNKALEDITTNSTAELDQTTGCVVYIGILYFDLNFPLYLQNPKNDVIKVDEDGIFNLTKGESFRMLCENPNIMKTITCNGSDILVDETYQPIDIPYEIKCTKKYQKAVFTRNNCMNGNKEIRIGYELPKSVFIPILQICFNDQTKDVLYTKQSLSKNPLISYYDWDYDIFGEKFDAELFGIDEELLNDTYNKTKQKLFINRLLNKPPNSNTYINLDNNLYLDNAPLSSEEDNSFHQISIHFYYVNTAPIWRTIRKGNWIKIKNSITRFVQIQNITDNTYVAYTGTYGRSKLDNKEIYLQTSKEKKIMFVPEVFWKIIYNENTKEGYVFIVVNNPHLISYTPICKDSCHDKPPIPINWDKNNATAGFAYCCELTDFLKVVPVPI